MTFKVVVKQAGTDFKMLLKCIIFEESWPHWNKAFKKLSNSEVCLSQAALWEQLFSVQQHRPCVAEAHNPGQAVSPKGVLVTCSSHASYADSNIDLIAY